MYFWYNFITMNSMMLKKFRIYENRGSNIIMGKIVDGGGSNILMGKIVDDDLQFRGKIHDYRCTGVIWRS